MSAISSGELQYMQQHIHENRSEQIIAANVVCAVAAYLFVALRFASRPFSNARYGPDDWLILASLTTFTGYIVSSALIIKYGEGKHIILVTNQYGLVTTTLAAETLYNGTIPLIKISILSLYDRIFPQRKFKYALVGVGLMVIAYQTAQILAAILQCTPPRKLWYPDTPGTCIDFLTVTLATGTLNVITEVMILALPMPLLWRLKLPTRKKCMLSVVFLVGGSVCIISIVRLIYAKTVTSKDPDPSYDSIPVLIASTVELTAGIISASIPTLGPIFNKALHTLPRFASTYPDLPKTEDINMSNARRGTDKGWTNIVDSTDEPTMHDFGEAQRSS